MLELTEKVPGYRDEIIFLVTVQPVEVHLDVEEVATAATVSCCGKLS